MSAVYQRQYWTNAALPVNAATTLTLNEASGFDNRDTRFNLVIKPNAVGTGTVALSWASAAAPDDFITARDALGVAMVANMADAVTIFEIDGIDLYKLKLTPGAVVTTASYTATLISIGN